MSDPQVLAGDPTRLGAHVEGDGVAFSVFSQNAEAMHLCLFDAEGRESHRLRLPERDGDVWHGRVPGLAPGQRYGYRAEGPFDPANGHRFNPQKLLLDPYARNVTGQPKWHDALHGGESAPDPRDSAPYMPRGIVEDPDFDWGDHASPDHPLETSVIYETHVKGFTRLMPGVDHPGSFLGLASDAAIDHLVDLGITTVELLPIQMFVNDRFLVEKSLTNYWGYQTLGFFAPDPRYLTHGRIREFQHTVARLHAAGIEVILDVVYNHTAEGDESGPTLSFRGLDNASYYRLMPDRRHYVNDTGTGNTININHPMVMRMVLDSLRYWAEVMRVDGFRFDLCTVLGRTSAGFDARACFFRALRQDPVLATRKLIAEPWDLGPGGYQLGAYPPPFAEWNDQFRDEVRRFWRGDPGHVPALADRITGSARQFDHDGRAATSSVNFVTAHDGFTLSDVVSYARKQNEANGEDNRDGHNENHSDNLGTEGPSTDPGVVAARLRRRKNMMATLLLAQGTPMILAGDEVGHSQKGNNNAYAQDNATTWIDWAEADESFRAFVKRMIAFRRDHPILRQKRFLHSIPRKLDGLTDLFWLRPDGAEMTEADWTDEARAVLCAELRIASGTPDYAEREDAIFLAFNRGEAVTLNLPARAAGRYWVRHVDTSLDGDDPAPVEGGYALAGDAVAVFVEERA